MFCMQFSAVIESVPSSPKGACVEDLYRRSTVYMFWYRPVQLSDVLTSRSGAGQPCITVHHWPL